MYQIMIEATPGSILSHSRMMELGQAFNDMFGLGEYDIEECIVEGDPEEFMIAKGYKIRKQEPRAKKKATVKNDKKEHEDEETEVKEVKEKKKRLEGGEEEEGKEVDQERNVEVNSAATEQSLNEPVMGLDISAHVAGVITRRMMVEFDSCYIAFMITVPNEIQLRKEVSITKSTVEQTKREEALSKREIELPINTRLTEFYPPQHENENQQPSEE
ncbi:hypothetical protein D6D13_03127 [Aureobasidium pullulans]|uniref:Uncharacterized protein n=1 Tax=Aureobasidium pullulans TaxID=5580 RepID=A0A4S9D252_AURPU|nr:hypothetical protein D6D13_03127 [Aureobasidium pullulans]